jgi:hypothetical protein
VVETCSARYRLIKYNRTIVALTVKSLIIASVYTQQDANLKNKNRHNRISLIKLVENSNLDNLYIKAGCHVVSKAFSISKNTTAVDILLLKLRVTWPVSLMQYTVVL